MDIREYLKTHDFLLFDGAMGTYYAASHREGSRLCEEANLTAPADIETIHRSYLAAGAAAIKTNTFGANRLVMAPGHCAEIIRAGYDIAFRAAGENAFVFADIGPIETGPDTDPLAEYCFLAETFLAVGARHFLFETQSSLDSLPVVAAFIKERAPESFIIVSFAVQPDGFTRSGQMLSDIFPIAARDSNIDAVGLNCVSGARHMRALTEELDFSETLLSVMPNAGYPTVRGNRTFYDGDPDYFAQQMQALQYSGAKILGGCCGTTPAYIATLKNVLEVPTWDSATVRSSRPASSASDAVPASPTVASTREPVRERNAFWDSLCNPAKRPFAVELDSPANADVTKFMAGALELQEKGADILTVADCPVARARMDSSLMACKLRRELSIDALPHMTCRDRNLNATQALLLGLCAEGIRNVLIVTGDPIPSSSRDEVKSVYNFNSRKLIQYVDGLNRAVLPVPFHIFGALNLNARNFHIQLDLAREKEENGACGFLTQPVHTAQALENLTLARETLRGKILGGIFPIVSEKNARYMNSEIAGIKVDEAIIRLYQGADRAKGEELAVKISSAIAEEIAPYVDGFYLMTPFGRTGLIGRIMDAIRADGLA